MVSQIRLKGLDKRLLNRVPDDGYCDTIENMRPRGRVENHYWEPVKTRSEIKLGDSNAKGSVEFEFSYGEDFNLSSFVTEDYTIIIRFSSTVLTSVTNINPANGTPIGLITEQVKLLLESSQDFTNIFDCDIVQVGTSTWKLTITTKFQTGIHNGTQFNFDIYPNSALSTIGQIVVPNFIPIDQADLGVQSETESISALMVTNAKANGILTGRAYLAHLNLLIEFDVPIEFNMSALQVAERFVSYIPHSVNTHFFFDTSESDQYWGRIKMTARYAGTQYNGSYITLDGNTAYGVVYDYSGSGATTGGTNPVDRYCLERFTINASPLVIDVILKRGDTIDVIKNKISSAFQENSNFTSNYILNSSSNPTAILISKIDAGKPDTTLSHQSIVNATYVDSQLSYSFVDATINTFEAPDIFAINSMPSNNASGVISYGLDIQKTAPLYSFWQNRTGYGKFSTNLTASLERLIVVYEDRIAFYEESADDQNYFIQSVDAVAIPNNTYSEIKHTVIDETCIISISQNDKPLLLYSIIDDYAIELSIPSLPGIKIEFIRDNATQSSGAFVSNGNSSPKDWLMWGYYGFKFGYYMENGDIIMLSELFPVFVAETFGIDTVHGTLTYIYGQYESSNDQYKVSYSIKVSIERYVADLNKYFKALIKGVAVFMTPRVDAGNLSGVDVKEPMYNSLLYKVADIPIKFTNEAPSATIELNNDSISTMSALSIDTINSNNRILCNMPFSFNKRLVLGGMATDYHNPNGLYSRIDIPVVSTGSLSFNTITSRPSSGIFDETYTEPVSHKFVVRIDTEIGCFYRESEEFLSLYNVTPLSYGRFEYLDRRADIVALMKKEGNTWVTVYEFALKKSQTLNSAYVIPTYQNYVDAIASVKVIPNNPDTKKIAYEPRKFAISTANNPYIFKGENVYRVGQYNNEIIQGFGSNTLPISTGQFGEYPLYVFTNKGVWAMQQGSEEVAFASVQPVSLTEGALNPKSITNMAQVICFVSYQGVYLLANGKLELISQPINDEVDWISLQNDIAIHYFNYKDIREIWISTDTKTYIYSLEYNTWHTLTRTANRYFTGAENSLYSLSGNKLYREDFTAENEAVYFKTRPILFGSIDILKRLFNTFVRDSICTNYKLTHITKTDPMTSKEVYNGKANKFRTQFGSAYGFVIEGSTEGFSAKQNSKLELIQLEYETRYEHRIRG